MPALANHPDKEQLGRSPTDTALEKPLAGRKDLENAPSCCAMTTAAGLRGARFAAAAALKQCDVLLAGHRAGVVGIDYVNTGTCVARQCEQVNPLPVQEPESDGAGVVRHIK